MIKVSKEVGVGVVGKDHLVNKRVESVVWRGDVVYGRL
jgi:hypothetical protein